MAQRQFEVVSDDLASAPSPNPRGAQAAAIGMLGLALKALSQRALIAAADLFTLFTVLTVFWLWWTIPSPDEKQIVALSIYAAFILTINVIIRRK